MSQSPFVCRRVALTVFFAAVSVLSGSVQLLPALPNSAVPAAMRTDAAGNIYVAGTFVPTGKNVFAAFAAKLTPGGQLLYFTPLQGSVANSRGTVLAALPDGSVYIAGNTFATDFPTTPGALLTTGSAGGAGFLAKLSPAGSLTYSTFIGGVGSTLITGMTLDARGDVFLSGTGGPSVPANSMGPLAGFVLEIDPGLTKVLLSEYGYGGGLITLDAQGNIYLAGNQAPQTTSNGTLGLPTLSAGAFQPTHDNRFCFTAGTGPGGPGGSLSCQYQYVAKLNSAGTLQWATYVTGTYGAIASGIAVDSLGQVIVAGSTYSDDYPVTAGAFQTAYAAGAPTFPNTSGNGAMGPPPVTGYVTKVNATGTGLVWSTYLGGSYGDNITAMEIAPSGVILLAGYADSTDFPALAGTADGCRPSANQILGFVTRLAADGATAGPTQLATGAPVCTFYGCAGIFYSDYPNYPAQGPMAFAPNGTLVFGTAAGRLASIDFSVTNRLGCVVDPADYIQLSSVAPGELITLFGTDIAPAAPFTPAGGVAASTASFGVFFDGIAAPIIYSDAQQINVQVPYEIAGRPSVQMKLVNLKTTLPATETLTLGVVQRQASVFLSAAALVSPFPGYTVCGGTMALGTAGVALNADGTLNDCGNPAAPGTKVTVFLNGLGPVTPALATGVISAAPAVALAPAVIATDSTVGLVNSSTLTVPGAITGVGQLQFQLPPSLPRAPYTIFPMLEGTTLRERAILIWTRGN